MGKGQQGHTQQHAPNQVGNWVPGPSRSIAKEHWSYNRESDSERWMGLWDTYLPRAQRLLPIPGEYRGGEGAGARAPGTDTHSFTFPAPGAWVLSKPAL